MMDLLLNAISSGVLLGGFYAAVTVGIAISFGMLDIGNLAHPAFIIFGSFTAYILNSRYGIDPIVAGVLVLPGFLLLGALVYEIYYLSLIHISEPTRQAEISYAVFCLKKKKTK